MKSFIQFDQELSIMGELAEKRKGLFYGEIGLERESNEAY
jgi:hypothetical protein